MVKSFKLTIKRSSLEKVITALTFIFVYGFIAYLLDLRLIFANTTVAGGDTGSHVYIPYYLKEIFPLIRWWSPDWYSGFPFLYFYPPLVYFLTVILSFIIPINIAFKVLIAVCFLIYPLVFYLIFRLLNFKFPMPQIAMVFSLFLIFLEKYSIYGGNLPSLLSGQFSHTLSIALLFLFLALVYRGVVENKYRIYTVIIGAFVILSHPVSGILLIGLAPFLLFSASRKSLAKRFIYLIKIYLGVFLLSAFWTIPLVFYQKYAGIMNWTKQVEIDSLLPQHWAFLSFSAALGVVVALGRRERKLIPFLATFSLCLFLYLNLDNYSVWNTRFLPYLNFGILFIAAYFIGLILSKIWEKAWFLALILFFMLSAFSFYQVKNNTSYSSVWFKWNFEGYQQKPGWISLGNLFTDLSSLDKGRVLWEYNDEYDKYGTPRVLEALPVFTKQPTFEGLLIESSLFGPFHFINQAETSLTPTAAIAGFDYPPFNFKKGIEHMRLSGVKYFVPYTEKVKQEVRLYPEELIKIEKKGRSFEIYELQNSSLVDLVKDYSVEIKDAGWLKRSTDWYKDGDLNKPIIYAKDKKEKKELEQIKDSLALGINPKNVKWGGDYVEFKGSVGSAYIIKNTYFPTWRVSGAKGPYLVSPSYIIVIPTQENVKLYFAYGLVDWVGLILSGAGIGYLIFIRKQDQS